MKKSLLLLLGAFVLCGTVLLGCNNKVEPANKTDDAILEISAVQSTTTSNAVEITWRTSVKSYKYSLQLHRTLTDLPCSFQSKNYTINTGEFWC